MKRLLVFLSLFSCLYLTAFAQNKQGISGSVKDAEGNPLPGITVIEKGTTNGAVTDGAGNFSLQVNPDGVLVLSGIGFFTQEIAVAGKTAVDIRMAIDNKNLGEVVVTALGIKREKKSLGYALQEVNGEALVNARESNVANALSGKVAGLQVIRSSNGPAGSSKIVLRGNNSLTGSNQPLIVVDGIPMDNFTGAENTDFWNPSRDMGNGLADINPEDIESMSVLKGPAAAALYGSRAGNGVILITTKTGKKQKGLGITYSSQLGFSETFTTPEMQSAFGQGTEGVFDPISEQSWGPQITGQQVTDWQGKNVSLGAHNNLKNYLNTGVNVKNTLSFQQQVSEATSLYTSITHLNDKSIIPGTKLTRTNLTTRAVSHFGAAKRWTTDAKVQYINSKAVNRPQNGVNSSNVFSTLYMLPVSLNIEDFSAAKRENGKMLWYGSSNRVNPYWSSQYDLNEDARDRFLMAGSVKYDFTSWLNAELKGGADIYTTNFEAKRYAGSPSPANGSYSNGKETFTETNYSALINAHQDNLFGKLGGAVSLGGNLMRQKRSKLSADAGELQIPDFFAINNGKNNPTVTETFREKRINSVYGTLGLNWDAYWFIDATFRNDWSSALSKENRSYFYPSVSTSLIITDMISRLGGEAPSWISYGKVRASYAEVGNDLDPYELYNTYEVSKDPNGNTVVKRKAVLYDPNVRSELIRSVEVGAEARLFNNRVGLDVAWYKSNATRQLINLPMDPLSGYSSKKINGGDIQNTGVELMLNARVLDKPQGLSWDVMVNYSNNKNTVKEIGQGISQYSLGGYDDVQVYAVAGERYGEIWGTGYQRVTDESSPYFGKIIVNENGLPLATSSKIRLGNQQASGLLGVTNTFYYKGVSLGFQVDARFGGKMFAGSLSAMQRTGTAASTVVNGQREDILVDGVVYDADTKTYSPNTQAVSPQQYWVNGIGINNVGIVEANIYDASNVRLRNVQLSYALPAKLLSKTPIQRASIGFSCNNVWLISSHMHGIDPESVYATSTNAVGFENGSVPTSRTFLFNLSVSF
ncbi:SusC/RagA family TonB-linked outer membrane protein [Chitinophaga japonensis]|uniref:TonB-linked SusC/RagA family outer membrane protein n=1 Tax=Chitinophaga japonensis TaxID=104662 RepID=A0A562T2V2_CHIJA|nr:SusC/RagA family TonB-linked outer membrane protein [Chitinophaga japonensis]TWI87892.1 TonB-linked SusC/RagA family outer membrane protein [Chitinophaga japonensis]